MSQDLSALILSAIKKLNDKASLMVKGLHVNQSGHAMITLEVPKDKAPQDFEPLCSQIEQEVLKIETIQKASVILTRHQDTASQPPKDKNNLTIELPYIKHIIAVASGKGGVGKSTTAVNLALAFANGGAKVGLMDADVYGPSLPKMMNLQEKPLIDADKKMIPLERYGVKCMSLGLLLSEENPVIWRGPMVMGAVSQLLKDVVWGPLDILIIDMPPGTGDVPLTLAQRITLSGAIIVSTPQDIALLDARKSLNMFLKLNVPILGIVENMSYFICPHCHEHSEIFSHGGARQEARQRDLPFLGELALDPILRKCADLGQNLFDMYPESLHVQVYQKMVEQIMTILKE
jgi:ATP-binding protein involved in chromosome partitioning